MSAATPGPWHIKATYQGALTDRFKGIPCSINGADGFQPCLILGDGTENRGVAEANAHLIAAAPDLKSALEASTRMLILVAPLLRDGPHSNKEKFVDDQIANNRAALAKSSGQG